MGVLISCFDGCLDKFDDSGNNIVDRKHSDIQCFYSSKGSSLELPYSPHHSFGPRVGIFEIHSGELLKILSQSGEELISFSFYRNFDGLDVFDSVELLTDVADLDFDLESFKSDQPYKTINTNDSNVFQGEFHSISNKLGYQASGCFRVVD
jgi:hypothetical protein